MMTSAPPISTEAARRLEANLAALAGGSPAVARQVIAVAPSEPPALEFVDTFDPGAPSALHHGVPLASRKKPLEEGERLASTMDLRTAAAAVFVGFGLGYHVAALARRMKREGLIVVFEPDVALLRAVMERIDHASWIRQCNVVFLTDPDDTSALTAVTHGIEGVLALGTRMIEHPPSRARLGDQATRFGATVARVMSAVRTVVVTTMVQTEVTVRNLLMNSDHYVRTGRGGGVKELEDWAKGSPAIVVSAGPSLRRNIALLKTPGLADRCVIIAVQTVLKTLLAEGVRPHFVTALDYHEISRRFYEGLTPADVEGVTLVAEPKANPAILDSYPGAIRCVGDEYLDECLGVELAGDHGRLPPGATVAHLAYYLARHVGADPVILVGQDLGFTDGQYYSKGAAIHDVWAAELNPFNTLEMMEWQRIVRGRRTLRKATDFLGRPVYTDEQMHTYLAQFERDFREDSGRGLRVIDATEGGVAKRHTTRATLREAIERFVTPNAPALRRATAPPERLDARAKQALERRLREVRSGAGKVGELSRKARAVVERMAEHQSDQKLVNRLVAEVSEIGRKAGETQPAYSLVQKLNQAGGFKRARADRQLRLSQGLSPMEVQRAQLERDRMNLTWLADSADALARMVEGAISAAAGAPKLTRDPAPAAAPDADGESGPAAPARPARIAAVIPVDFDHSSVGAPRALDATFLGQSPLRATLERLSRCRHIDTVILLTPDPDGARVLVGPPAGKLRIELHRTDGPAMGRRPDGLRGARLWADWSWRGGLCSLTCYDEVLAPAPTIEALERFGFDGALIVGADWCLVDPGLCDALVERHRENPARHRLTFCQAPPGLAGCLLERGLLAELGASQARGGPFASLGGVLGYVPINPLVDPIAQSVCVPVPAPVRDTLFRCVPDSAVRRSMLEQALLAWSQEQGWKTVVDSSSEQIAQAVLQRQKDVPSGMPKQTILELCVGRAAGGARMRWLGHDADAIDRPIMTARLAERVFHAIAEQRSDAVVDFAGVGDPLLHPQCAQFVRMAKEAGIAGVHVRTDLLAPTATIDALLDSGVDVISVDLLANTAETYRALVGRDAFRQVTENIERLLARRPVRDGLPTVWVVPRIMRCDAAYEEIEAFYDKWLLLAGAAMIDQLPRPIEGERIEPLGKPDRARRRDWRSRLLVLSDGSVPLDERDVGAEGHIGNVANEPVATVWRRLLERRRAIFHEYGYRHESLWTGW